MNDLLKNSLEAKNKSYLLILLPLILLITLTTTSCSILFDSEKEASTAPEESHSTIKPIKQNQPELKKTSKVAIEGDADKTKLRDEIEVIWDKPDTPVNEYLIQYGFSEDTLTNELKISSEDLEVSNDPEHGEVYRFIIDDIPTDKRVFIRLAEYHEGIELEFSETFEVAPSS